MLLVMQNNFDTRWKVLALTLCVLALTGCINNLNPFINHTDYQIAGLDEDSDTRSYLENLVKERVAEPIPYDEGTEDFQRAELAQQTMLAEDLKKGLRAKGYYDARLEYVDNAEEPLSGTYQINRGAQYIVSALKVEPESAAELFNYEIIHEGDALEALQVLQAQKSLRDSIQKDSCYFSLKVDHAVELDRKNKSAILEYSAEIGQPAEFGPVTFEGQETVELPYLQKLSTWKEGDCFRQEKITALRTKLLESGLFVAADSVLPDAPDENGRVPVTIKLKERVHRTIKAGASYYTDEGPGILLGWEHRNILGQGEKLETELKLSSINQSLNADLTKPFFIRKDQSLTLSTAIRQQDTDAYEELALDLGAHIKRQFHKRLSGDVGVRFTFSEITDEDDTRTYGLVSFPVGLAFDNRDNQLDPHKGWYLTGGAEPFYDVLGESDPFTKLELGARTYLSISDKPDVVLALRANAGSIVGGATSNVPATERFYAGGGGSIRGFGYQQVGPFDSEGDPTGGRSMFTGSTELRYKITDTIGAVTFVDAGSVSESAVPDMDNFSIGAGAGLRYYTGFGPLRFDIAVPLNQKENLDRDYQFYISIGQAF